ncbi:MAG: nucleoside triphosphate pyrophosphohydrolase [Synergistaceae bacterium]|nr:nucleoside triphosphate pyrophosphohydrolase [Synergistaceae bacterium]
MCEPGAETFGDLVEILRRLRSPGGCPWDAEQTLDSLRRYIIEESYELVEAIEDGSPREICEECGDVLLQVIFVSAVASELGMFGIGDVTRAICAKLINRHPHVFGDVRVRDAGDVSRNWEAIKASERAGRNEDKSAMAGIPRGMPSLLRSLRMQERAAKKGFDWPQDDIDSVKAKVLEELDELRAEVERADLGACQEELGDVLFAAVNLARHLEIDPESALQSANKKFSKRFRNVEAQAAGRNIRIEDLSLDELEDMWQTAKRAAES